ncbi:hypothetical protein MKX03_029839 [Papaver bracteatum]|nr:hypothetical protein MKX03_029839 [Papaver bracteatum]
MSFQKLVQKKSGKLDKNCSFDYTGPVHLTVVDWQNAHHRRSIAASLVSAAYILELDRQENRQGCEALAPQWWEFFNFQLLYPLIDTGDSSIFGAVYEFYPTFTYYQMGIIPKYVIAFRGTIIKKQSVLHITLHVWQDLWLDLNIMKYGLHQSSRFGIAMQAVKNMVSAAGASNVWLTGHSLGSSIAMLIGKNMEKMGNYMDTYHLNSRFNSLVKAGLSVSMKGTKENRNPDNIFTALVAWVPKLFVNQDDLICSEYIGYFEQRDRMEHLGASEIERLETQTSVIGLLKSSIRRDSEVIHLVPSAHMTINRSPSLTFMEAHGLQQCLRDDLHLQSKDYQYRL